MGSDRLNAPARQPRALLRYEDAYGMSWVFCRKMGTPA